MHQNCALEKSADHPRILSVYCTLKESMDSPRIFWVNILFEYYQGINYGKFSSVLSIAIWTKTVTLKCLTSIIVIAFKKYISIKTLLHLIFSLNMDQKPSYVSIIMSKGYCDRPNILLRKWSVHNWLKWNEETLEKVDQKMNYFNKGWRKIWEVVSWVWYVGFFGQPNLTNFFTVVI